jgi:GNAT superfamily N-acetyltransferase
MIAMRAVVVRSVRRSEAVAIRALRLRALADAPYAFSSFRARELARPDEFWQELARESEHGRSRATFVAVEGDEWIGMAGILTSSTDPGCGDVWGMWVAPSARNAGVGRLLMDSIRSWATTHGLERLRLSVSTSEQSAAARRFYETLGFTATGEQEEMKSDPALRADVMTFTLTEEPAD